MKVALKIFLSTLIVGTIIRIMFFLTHFMRGGEFGILEALKSFLNGLSLDATVAGYITAPIMLILLIARLLNANNSEIWKRIINVYLIVVALLMSLVVGIDLNLYRYWSYRVDGTLLPYLMDAKNVGSTLAASDLLLGFGGAIISFFAFMWFYSRATKGFTLASLSPLKRLRSVGLILLASGFVFLAIRGGVSESVANVSRVYFSANQFLNHAAVNPVFSLFSSLGEAERYDEYYPFYSKSQLRQRFDALRGKPSMERVEMLKSSRPDVLIIIAEGYTRLIVDSLVEGRAVMPNIKRHMNEGLEFTNVYATGWRTDKGVSSALSGFPAQPKVSVMKIPAKSRMLPSLARSMGEVGYESAFFYGGDLDFMDMGSYLLSTGWGELNSASDVKSKEGQRAWGYSDGAMVDFLAREIEDRLQKPSPQLLAWLSLSSHEPFDVPANMGFEDKILNSFAYSDAHLGRLLDELKRSKVWDNLLVVLVADHALTHSHKISYSSPQHYRIPMFWTGGALAMAGAEVSGFVSQMDLPSTLLAQMGISNEDFIFSRNALDPAPQKPAFGYYTFSDGFGVVDGSGARVYDNISQSVAVCSPEGGAPEAARLPLDSLSLERVEWGKTILQMSHEELSRIDGSLTL